MIKINLLPIKAAKRKEYSKQQLILFGLIIFVVALGLWAPSPFPSWTAIESSKLATARTALEKKQHDIAELEKIIGQLSRFQEDKKQLETKLGIIEKLKKGKTGPVRVLDEISIKIPKKVWISSLKEESGPSGRMFVIKGEAVSNEDVSNFMNELGKSKYFSNIQLSFTSRKMLQTEEIEYVEYEIRCNVNYSA